MIDSDFMPMTFKSYDACSEKFEDVLKTLVKAASEVHHVPYYSALLNYWRKRFSVTLQTFDARLIAQAYLVILIMLEEISSVILVLLKLLRCCRLKLLSHSVCYDL